MNGRTLHKWMKERKPQYKVIVIVNETNEFLLVLHRVFPNWLLLILSFLSFLFPIEWPSLLVFFGVEYFIFFSSGSNDNN